MIIKSPHVADRRDFGAFANFHKVALAAEVGVDQGNFSIAFLSQWRGEKMYLIDPYNNDSHFAYDRQWDYQCVIQNLGRHCSRVRFIRDKSVNAVNKMPPKHRGHLGFVYIDGDHSYGAVVKDIETWWPEVKAGGILAGHDFNWEGVREAVTEFADREGLEVFHTHEPDNVGPSWYILKGS